MKKYREISTQQEMDALIESIAGFHDSMTKEMHFANRGYVAANHSMAMPHQLDARLLIQSQWKPYALELVFIGIENFSVSDPGEYWGATGRVTRQTRLVEKQIIDFKFDSSLHIRAERLFWCDRTDWLGQRARFQGEVPSPNAIPASPVEGNWRQCSGCANVWEEDVAQDFSHCPECGALTERQV